jgi:hypothetical protein
MRPLAATQPCAGLAVGATVLAYLAVRSVCASYAPPLERMTLAPSVLILPTPPESMQHAESPRPGPMVADLPQQVIQARYLGMDHRFGFSGERTRERCNGMADGDALQMTWGVMRFELVSRNPWPADPDLLSHNLRHMRIVVPCPELSRRAFAKLYDLGGGTAGVLRRGRTYKLTVFAQHGYYPPVAAGQEHLERSAGTEPEWDVVSIDQ